MPGRLAASPFQRACQRREIQFCFALHPQLHSPRPLDPTSDADFEKLWPHFSWAQALGVKWFSVTLDDVSGIRIDGAEHARLANKLLARLRARDPKAQLILCPTRYWGDGTSSAHRAYLKPLGRELHKDVYLFWTGDRVVTPRITRRCAESYRSVVKHRLVIWDNYPVNDNHSTLHLGPVTGRDRDLCQVADGYMSNPLCTQNQANRIPLLTCADYAYNPWGYDPARSIGQAILHLADSAQQRDLLKDLVEAYPGMDDWRTSPEQPRLAIPRAVASASRYLRRAPDPGRSSPVPASGRDGRPHAQIRHPNAAGQDGPADRG